MMNRLQNLLRKLRKNTLRNGWKKKKLSASSKF